MHACMYGADGQLRCPAAGASPNGTSFATSNGTSFATSNGTPKSMGKSTYSTDSTDTKQEHFKGKSRGRFLKPARVVYKDTSETTGHDPLFCDSRPRPMCRMEEKLTCAKRRGQYYWKCAQ